MDKKLYARLLSIIPLFRSLSPDELDQIVQISKLLRVKKGVTVVEEGDEGAAMYILVEGKCEVVKRLPGGDNTRLAELAAPTVFGEMSLIDQDKRSASVCTLTDVVLFQINLHSFNKLRAGLSAAAFKVLREIAPMLCSRVRQINDRIGDFFKNPEANLGTVEQQFLQRSLGSPKPAQGK
jgi:CRP-like cAMP-binding protein